MEQFLKAPVAGAKNDSTKEVDSLTYAQRQRYHYLFSIYNNHSTVMELVIKIQGRGRNGWSKVNEKIGVLNFSNRDIQKYHDALYDNFEVGETYSSPDIITIVGEVRRDLGLDTYTHRLKKSCEEDFFTLFIVEDAYDTILNGKIAERQFLGYKPIFKLKSED